MQFTSLASSSSGNCSFITEGASRLLIDAGISLRRISVSLRALGSDVRELCGVLITHEHSDHINGLPMLLKHSDIEIYTTETVAEGLVRTIPASEGRINVIPALDYSEIAGFEVMPFHTMHDTPESVGYRICGHVSAMAFATDLGTVTREVEEGMSGVKFAVLESNHDVQKLKNGPYPYIVKKRVLSDHGHLSNDVSASFQRKLAENGAKRILLAHLSKENNTPGLALEASTNALSDTDVRAEVAPYDGISNTYIF